MHTSAPPAPPQTLPTFPSTDNQPQPVRRPRSYDKRPREYVPRRTDWHRFHLSVADRQGGNRKKSATENRWQLFFREEKLLILSWVAISLYLGYAYLHNNQQAQWLREEISNIQLSLSEKIDAASLQLNRSMEQVEKNSHDLDDQKARLQADENNWKLQEDHIQSTIQQIRTDLDSVNKELRENNAHLNMLEDKNAKHGAQIEQMREIQSMKIGTLDDAAPPPNPKNQASNSQPQTVDPLVASNQHVGSDSRK